MEGQPAPVARIFGQFADLQLAEERLRRGRTGVYDVRVTNQLGEVVALFRGQCRRIKAVPGGRPPTP